jgi:hypothetical protein
MHDIHAIRARNYLSLFEQFKNTLIAESGRDYGALDKFGKKVGITARYLTHINARRKRIGDESCRKIEAAFGLPSGWMDVSHITDKSKGMPQDDKESRFVATALKCFRADPLKAQEIFLEFLSMRMDTKT